jgi:hypothetical protein
MEAYNEPQMLRLAFVIAFLCLPPAGPAAQRGGRYRPPEGIPCSRDQLTSFTGKVTAYSRNSQRIRLTVYTDWDTSESFVLRAPFRMRFKGEPFREEHWNKIEEKEGRLRPGVRATVWACETGERVLDWETPAETR